MSKFHPKAEECVDLLCTKTMSDNRHFYRILMAYYFSKMASMVRTNIKTKERGIIPVNTYAINLMPSGEGKGFSTNIVEESLISGFKDRFFEEVFVKKANANINLMAQKRSLRDSVKVGDWKTRLNKEFAELGPLPFSFDSATGPAIKQLRQKLLIASSGSMNIEIDEIGHNLVGNAEALTVLFELYDKGKVKQKLTKNTRDNIRLEEIEGYTPTNLMMFGNPAKLLDGAKTEEEFWEMLLSGYARRLLFGYQPTTAKKQDISASDMYDLLTDRSIDDSESQLRAYFTSLAATVGPHLEVSKEVTIEMIQYKIDCEKLAAKMSDFQETEKAEMAHRYFKALKLAGAYAFIDKELEISSKNLNYAINLVEESGKHFNRILKKEGTYVRLAKFIASTDKEMTEVDLMESLPFYRGTKEQKKTMMSLAVAWGHKNNVVIKRSFLDEIEFFSGESLDETDLNNLIISHSTHMTKDYANVYAPFNKLHRLCLLPGNNFVSFHLHNNYRDDEHVSQKTGCNMVVIDVDSGTQVHEAQKLLADYSYYIYKTKRSTDKENRFRLIMPLSHVVKLNAKDYEQFMTNIFNWLPFDCDTGAKDRCRKWLTCEPPNKKPEGNSFYNEGELLDVTNFIPRTDKAQRQENYVTETQNMTALERWFYREAKEGNRNTILLRYGLALVDNGVKSEHVMNAIHAFNKNLPEPLDPNEIDRTIMKTITKRSIK